MRDYPPHVADAFLSPEPFCDWGVGCPEHATESAQAYGEIRPFCAKHGELNRVVTSVSSQQRRREAREARA